MTDGRCRAPFLPRRRLSQVWEADFTRCCLWRFHRSCPPSHITKMSGCRGQILPSSRGLAIKTLLK